MSEDDLAKKKIEQAIKCSESRDFEDAIKLCTEAIIISSDKRKAYKERSFIYAKMKLWDKAIEDVTHLIDSVSKEPCDFFTRGRWLLAQSNWKQAIEDFTTVLSIEEEINNTYYSESAYFFRAVAYLYKREYEKAIKDCFNVRDGFSIYLLGSIKSKEEIIMEAKRKKK